MPTRPHDSNKHFFTLVFCLVLAVSIVFAVRMALHLSAQNLPFATDFPVFWNTAHQLVQGSIENLYPTQNVIDFIHRQNPQGNAFFHPFPYPPTALIFLKPLGRVSYETGLLIWGIASAFCLVTAASTQAARKLMPALTAQGKSYYGLAIFAALMPYLILIIFAGQATAFFFALIVAGLCNLERKPLLAGVMLGLVTIKPQLALLIPVALLCGGHFRALNAFALTALALFEISALLYGADIWWRYADFATAFSTLMAQAPEGWQPVMISPFISLAVLGLPHSIVWPMQLTCSFMAIGMTAITFHSKRPLHLKIYALLIATLLCSPYMFVYDMALLGFAALLLTDSAMQPVRTPDRIIAVLLLFAPLVSTQLQTRHIPYAFFVILLALGVSAFRFRTPARSAL